MRPKHRAEVGGAHSRKAQRKPSLAVCIGTCDLMSIYGMNEWCTELTTLKHPRALCSQRLTENSDFAVFTR